MLKLLVLFYFLLALLALRESQAQSTGLGKMQAQKLIDDKKACNADQMKEAMRFIQLYTECITGDELRCQVIVERATKGRKFVASAAAGAIAVPMYMSVQEVLTISNSILKDPKKYAAGASYRKTLREQSGGPEVDKYIEKNGKDLTKAHEVISKEIGALEGKALDAVGEKRFEELTQTQKFLKNRLGLKKSNDALLEKAIGKVQKVNDHVVDRIAEIDLREGELRAQMSNSSDAALKEKLKELGSEKKKWLEKIQVLETQSKEIGESFNASLSESMKRVQARAAQATSPEARSALAKTISALEKKKLKPLPANTEPISRYVFQVTEKGYGLVDITGNYEKLPDWAKEMRLAQVRETPTLAKEMVREMPELVHDDEKFFAELAKREHERYLEKTKVDYLTSHTNERRILATIGEDTADLSIKGSQFKLSDRKKWVLELTPEQNAAIQSFKPNWKDVNKPFAMLDKENIQKTLSPMIKFGEESLPGYEYKKGFSKTAKFFLDKARLGKAVGWGTRIGAGWIFAGATLFWDGPDLYEAGVSVAMSTKLGRENLWDKISPQCRMPKEKILGAADPIKEATPWFCGCQADRKEPDKVAQYCNKLPSQMDSVSQEVCELARNGGRDHDLKIAQKYDTVKTSNPQLAAILKEAAGCDVMKNHPSNCRYVSDELTEQGLYFMSIIQKAQMYNSVSAICPDVCRHWVDIANKKMQEVQELKSADSLPDTASEDKLDSKCSAQSNKGAPPEGFEAYRQWRECQKQIQCQGSGKASVFLKDRETEKYEIQFDPQSGEMVSARMIKAMQISGKRAGSPTAGQTMKNVPSFQYIFDSDGNLSHVQIFDSDNDGKTVKETISSQDIEAYFGNYSYNPNSFQFMRSQAELALNRRLELFMIRNKVVNYCCQNETDCSSELKGLPGNSSGDKKETTSSGKQ